MDYLEKIKQKDEEFSELLINEIRKGRDIYRFNNGGRNKFIWLPCPECNKPRWVQYVNGMPRTRRCKVCQSKHTRGGENAKWRGGRNRNRGYWLVWVSPDDFFYPMATKHNQVLEHRLVMAKHLGRNLHRWEIIHHKNGIRDDNRIENLQLVSDDRHKQITILERRIKHLESRVTMLEAENLLLRSESNDYISGKNP